MKTKSKSNKKVNENISFKKLRILNIIKTIIQRKVY